MGKLDKAVILEYWRSYSKEYVPDDCGIEQKVQTRLAFYMGATAMRLIMLRLGKPDISEEVAMAHMSHIQREMEQFESAMKNGDLSDPDRPETKSARSKPPIIHTGES